MNSRAHKQGRCSERPGARCKALLPKLLLMTAALILAIAIHAGADTVSGYVYNPDEKPAANMTLTAKPAKGDAVEFKTNSSGVFSVRLDPGRYTVTVSSDPSLQATVESYPQPVQLDIHLKKGPV